MYRFLNSVQTVKDPEQDKAEIVHSSDNYIFINVSSFIRYETFLDYLFVYIFVIRAIRIIVQSSVAAVPLSVVALGHSRNVFIVSIYYKLCLYTPCR